MTARLIVTIDTEEEGLWGGRYRAVGNTVENIRCLPRFQELCDRFGVRPAYLVDAPVVQDDIAVGILRQFHDDDRCEIGAHCHPWCNPPLDNGHIHERVTYLCNLPERDQQAKLEWLTEAIEQRFDRRPTSFRAGRYGLDASGAAILRDLGYLVDSSVIPFTDYTPHGGPDFRTAPCEPYFIDGDDLCRAHETGDLLEVPVSVGFNRPDFERAHALQQSANASWAKPFHVEGLLDRLGLVRRIKFSPEQADARSLKQLADACLTRRTPAIVLMFHSTSLLPGGSPYVPDAAALDRFLDRLESIFTHCLTARGMQPATLSEFAIDWRMQSSKPSGTPATRDAALVTPDGAH